MKFYYADSQTAEYLKSESKKVYLYGGFVGYNNFGDIIQLKYAIDFHRKNSSYEPVVVLHASSLESKDHLEMLKKWYDTLFFIFISDTYVDATDAGIDIVESNMSGRSLLHVYGGGYLNKYWGSPIVDKIESLIEDFNIDHYFFSGQQVEEKIIPRLNELFTKKQPLVFGVRDKDSFMLMESSSARLIKYSFDDVTEILQRWMNSFKPSIKIKVLNRLRPKSTLWHINISSYATVNKKRILEKLVRVKRDYPRDRMIVAQAYNDIRLSLKDSMQSLIQLENSVPYHEYRIINIAQMALDMNLRADRYPDISSIFNGIERTVSSSYHTAMLSLFFRKPTFLMSENQFYSQKQKALGLGNDFGEFMSKPELYSYDFTQELEDRKKWHEYLISLLNDLKDSPVSSTTIVYDIPDDKPKLKYRDMNS